MDELPIITPPGYSPDDADPRQASPLLVRIEASFNELRKSERAVAEFVLAHPNEVPSISIAEIAYRVGVSQPTVAPFVNALGFTGFTGFNDFKLRLAQCMASGVPYKRLERTKQTLRDKRIRGYEE